MKPVRFFMAAFLLLAGTCLPQTPRAQQMLNPARNEPLEITADQTLEWHRDKLQYIARGNVAAHQGTVTIFADTLTADYRETPSSSFEIYRLTADGNVRISSQGNDAYGQKAVYDVDKGVAIMTGGNLRLTSPDQTVTARESFEYWVAEGRLTAIGKARVVRGKDTLDAERIDAVFREDSGKNRRIESLAAKGNVVITTPAETLTGREGRYLAATNTAELFGNVAIRRGPNILEGEHAEVNLTTNVSKMHGGGGAGDSGRVRGVFYPGSEDKAPAPETPGPQSEAAPGPGQYTPRLLAR